MIVSFSVFILGGCASIITARSGGETGIPYYLPKPYILITKKLTPLLEKTTEKKDDKGYTIAIEDAVETITKKDEKDFYAFQIIYLPDLTQKYGLEIKSRTGEIKTNISFLDDWKLVGINLDADAKTSDIIKSIGEVISKVPLTKCISCNHLQYCQKNCQDEPACEHRKIKEKTG